MKLTKLSAATMAALAILGLGIQGQAHADALGQARMLITGFTITDGSVAGTPLDLSAFVPNSLGFTDNLSTSANLNGTPAAGAGIGLGFQPSVNAQQSCVGSCGVGENLFGVLAAPSSPSRARSDALLQNVPISGTLLTRHDNA